MNYQLAIKMFEELIQEIDTVPKVTLSNKSNFIHQDVVDDFVSKCSVLIRNFFPTNYVSTLNTVMNRTQLYDGEAKLQRLKSHIIQTVLTELRIKAEQENINPININMEIAKYQTSARNELIKNAEFENATNLQFKLKETQDSNKSLNEKLHSKMEELANQKGLADSYAQQVRNTGNELEKTKLELIQVHKELKDSKKPSIEHTSNIWLLLTLFVFITYIIFTLPIITKHENSLQKQLIAEGLLITGLIIAYYKDKTPQWILIVLGLIIGVLPLLLP